MKRKCAGLMMCVFMLCSGVFGQNTITRLKSIVEPLRLEIGYHKTINLIFPYSIKSIDRGSKDILVQKAIGMENILQVKAGIENLKETNLTVVTNDGGLYSFLLSYSKEPILLNLNLALSDHSSQQVGILSANNDAEAKTQTIAEKILYKRAIHKRIGNRANDIGLRVNGIYASDDLIYIQFELENSTNLKYDIDQLRIYIKDQKKSKRTASQEIEITPVYVSGNNKFINAQSKQSAVLVLPKFNIPDQKYLTVQMLEKNGGRHLSLRLLNRMLVHATPIK